MKTLDDLPAGSSWATRFRTTTFVDTTGRPVRPAHLAPGDVHPGTPQVYEGLGVIKTRDSERQLLVVVDTRSSLEFTVAYGDCWDWDSVEYVE